MPLRIKGVIVHGKDSNHARNVVHRDLSRGITGIDSRLRSASRPLERRPGNGEECRRMPFDFAQSAAHEPVD
jgi:hypothetical protein